MKKKTLFTFLFPLIIPQDFFLFPSILFRESVKKNEVNFFSKVRFARLHKTFYMEQ